MLRTAWSVIDRTPPSLLKEVLLVDDGNVLEHLGAPLDAEVALIPKTRVLRLPERVGLIRAKVRGVENVTGDVIVFMDSHCEVGDGWLEPLLAEIVRNPRAVALPIVDAIDNESFEVKSAIAEIGVFSWTMHFYWLAEPTVKTRPALQKQQAKTFPSPMMAGGIFAIGRKFFFESGTYDEGMDTWGGENFEMSFRLWMCGAELITVPCSRIGHVFRKKSPYKFKNRDPRKTVAYNLNRVADVWLDEYAHMYFHVSQNKVTVPTYGDVSARIALRDRLRCRSFDWYMQNVASIYNMYDGKPRSFQRAGLLRNEQTNECIYHEGNPQSNGDILAVFRPCTGIGYNGASVQEGPEAMHWYLTTFPYHGELRHESSYGSRCLQAHELAKNARVRLVRCYDEETSEGTLRWKLNEVTGQLSLANHPTGCLAASASVADQVIVTRCSSRPSPAQQWTFVPYSERPF